MFCEAFINVIIVELLWVNNVVRYFASNNLLMLFCACDDISEILRCVCVSRELSIRMMLVLI